jgi:hypothetical protein
MTMTKRTEQQLAIVAHDTERLLSELEDQDPGDLAWEDVSDLSAIGQAMRTVDDAERGLVLAVATARLHGRSWAEIGAVLGTSKQAAQQRFGHPEPASQR